MLCTAEYGAEVLLEALDAVRDAGISEVLTLVMLGSPRTSLERLCYEVREVLLRGHGACNCLGLVVC